MLLPQRPRLKAIFLIFAQKLICYPQVDAFPMGFRGFLVKITSRTGCLVSLGVIFTWGFVGGFYQCELLEILKWLSALIFGYNCWTNI